MSEGAKRIIKYARSAKAFMTQADVDVASDENLIRAAVAYDMLTRSGVIAPPKDDLDMPHSIATIASNFEDREPNTPHRANLFATKLDEVLHG